MSATPGFNREAFGYGYDGFRKAIAVTARDLGGYNRKVREAVAEHFAKVLTNEIRTRTKWYATYDWAMASDDDFDMATLVGFTQLTRRYQPPIATAPFLPKDDILIDFDGSHLELYEDAVSLVGSNMQMTVALITHHPGIYDTRKRARIDKWGPFITDSGESLLEDRYGGGPKSVQTLSPAAAHEALRKLVERHFKVSFTNVNPGVQKAA